MATTILLVDDNKEILAGMRTALKSNEDIKIIGDARDGLQAVSLVRELKPDIVVMDITMPYMNGIDATKEIISENPSIKVIALSMHSEWAFISKMIEAGATGYLLKDNIIEELTKAITIVDRGRIYISKRIKDISAISVREKLSRRQKSGGETYENK
ncbi:MAG: response regulator transcription factor [Acidobacteria bacterium]|nr:response regulator transcription factor [Acidobacteriota bacterium]